MTAFLQQYISPALPVILWLFRGVTAGLAVWLLVRCCKSLFRGRDRESWGFVTLSNGARYELYHWENVIGRARRADIRVNFPSVSRTHAILQRDDGGIWRVDPINRSSGVLLNGKRTLVPASLNPGDSIALGGVELFFFPSEQPQHTGQPKKRPSPVGSLWLLTFIQLLLWGQFAPGFGAENIYPVSAGFFGLCGLGWVLYGVSRRLHRRQFDLETLALLLATVGFAITAAWDPGALYKQLAAVALGMGIYCVLVWLLGRLQLAVKLRWPAAGLAAALLAFNVVMGERIFGAKNWISVGPISFQPSELVKLAFILAGAATLDRLFAKRNLIFTILFSAYCVGCLALMSDFGTALSFFVAFLCIAFLRTGDLPSIAMMVAAAAFGCGIILRFKPYIADRFSAWLHVWDHAQDIGYQQTRTMSAMASGGLFGAGADKSWLKYIGAANTDLVFGVVGEEFGFLLALCCVASLMLPIAFTLRCAATARSSFYTILSCATAAMLVCQMALNVLGAVDLLPLTGVTFPFVSMGGSSMISCWGLMAYLKAADTRQNASFALRLSKLAPDQKKRPSPPPVKPARQEGFFADRPDIPVDEIFGKEEQK